VVLSNSTRDKLVDTNPSPHNYLPTGDAAGVIVIPAASPSVEPIPGADDDHKPGHPLQNEFVLFHEYGHLLAHRLKIWSGNNWVNELVPNIFMNTYLVQSRTDLDFVLQDRRKNPRPALRYTSLADLDYLYGAVGAENYYWFQFQLERIADFLAQGQTMPGIATKLQSEFPAGRQKQETLDELNGRFSRIRAGFLELAGSLAGPTTISKNDPAACGDATPGTSRTTVAVDNRSSRPVVLTLFDGATRTIQPRSWLAVGAVVGAPIKLADGRCVVPRSEPTLTIIESE
jgi:hypothetical protein